VRETAVTLPDGSVLSLPVIGQGTWTMGEVRARRTAEIDALRVGFAEGMRVVDTAELYGAGGAERVLGEAMRDCRDDVFVVTKVWPSHAREEDLLRALRDSLRRLGTDHVDALLLHFPTRSVPIAETMRAFARVVREGLTRYVGLSNFLRDGAAGADAAAAGSAPVAFHEVRYGLDERRAERFAIPDAEAHGRVLLAYSPLAHGRLMRAAGAPVLQELARRRGVSPERLALAWSVARPGVVAIPKAVSPDHVRDNAAAADLRLDAEEIARLEAAFPLGPGDLPSWLPPYGAVHRLVLWGLHLAFRDGAGPA
jgi:diketogulonate reductase-like aldo/keto reductase